MYCSKCGAQIDENDEVCSFCGERNKKAQVVKVSGDSNYTVIAVVGFIFAAISLFFCPPLFGGLGIWFGFMVKQKGNPTLGYVLIGVAAACMVIGIILGALNGIQQFNNLNSF